MKILRHVSCLAGGLLVFMLSQSVHAYTVDCTGGVDPSVQSVINMIGNSEPITIDGVCSGQGVINITTSGVILQGAGGSANTANNIIEGRIFLRGALNTQIRFLTVNSSDQSAITMIDTAVLRLLGSVIDCTATTGPANALQVISSRVTLINSQISATAAAGVASGIGANSNGVVIFAAGTTVDIAASAEAIGVGVGSGGVIWLEPATAITASGATSIAASVASNGDLRSLSGPVPGQVMSLSGDILVDGGSANFGDLNHTSGSIVVIDGALFVQNSAQFDSAGPVSLRNSSMQVSASTVQMDVDAFLNSVVTLDAGSAVSGTVELMFGSKLAVLESSTLDTLIKDGDAVEETLFVDVTSAVGSVSTSKKDKKNK